MDHYWLFLDGEFVEAQSGKQGLYQQALEPLGSRDPSRPRSPVA